MSRYSFCLLAFSLIGLFGCSSNSTPTTPESVAGNSELTSSTDKKSPEAATEKEPQLDTKKLKKELAVPVRNTIAGRWLVSAFQMVPSQQPNTPPQFGEVSDSIIEIELDEQDPAKSIGTIVTSRGDVTSRELRLSYATTDTVGMEFIDTTTNKVVVKYDGRLISSRIVGAMLMNEKEVVPVRLVPTEERTFARIPQFIQIEEQAELMELSRSAVPEEDISEFAKQHPYSPLTRVGYLQLLQNFAPRKGQEEEVGKLITGFLKSQEVWGKRLRDRSMLDVCSTLVMTGHDLSATEDWLSRAEKELADSEISKIGGTKMLEGLRLNLRMRKTLELLAGSTAESREKGRALAVELLKEFPFNPIITWKLADEARDSKRIDEALRLYGELAVLPGQEDFLRQAWSNDPVKHVLPTERVAQLWKEKHGKADGVDAFLDKIYEDSLASFVSESIKERTKPEANKVVLIELFTGSRCPQCVSADVAVAALNQLYPSSMVVTLRYHQHIPGADPLTNEDSESRFFNYYRRSSTPTGAFNGKEMLSIGGPLLRINEVLTDLKKNTAEELEKTSAAKLELTATREGDVIKIACNATGEGLGEGRKRLRVVLAETRVDFKAPNGIRHHDMVVRQVVTGDKGVAPKDGAFKYEAQVDVAKLKASLLDYLTKYEKNQAAIIGSKPLDLKALTVVAFVQDDENKEVLQTIAVPVQ